MMWVVFTLLNIFLWSFGNIIDKVLLNKIIKNPFSYYIFAIILQSIFIFLIFLVIQPTFSLNILFLSFFSGLLGTTAFLLFMIALQKEEASIVIPLSYLGNVFIVILSYIFLNESFGLSKYVGIAFLILGAIVLSYKKSKTKKLHFTPALIYVILSSVIFASGTVFNKYALNFVDPWTFTVFGISASYIVSLLLLLKKGIRKDFLKTLKISKKYYFVATISQFFGVFGFIALLIALSLGPATLVSSIGASKPLVILILTIILSVFLPNILKEKIDRKNMVIKVFSTILIIVGAIITIL